MKKKSIETGYPFFYSKLPLLINLSPVFEPTPSNTPHLFRLFKTARVFDTNN